MKSALAIAERLDHEELHVLKDRPAGLCVVIAIHDTTLGSAVGGTRMRSYPSLEAAAVDALRLARGMTYKAALAGLRCGGGKAVILGDPTRDKSAALLEAYARAVDRLGGRFYTGCDMGIGAEDVEVMRRFTPHLGHAGAQGLDTGELAALGTFCAIETAARRLGRTLGDLSVAVQGLGQVGLRLARRLREAGARLIVTDQDEPRLARAVRELDARSVAPEAVYEAEVDVFSPNAEGSVLNRESVPRLRCRAVVGAANEQLARSEDGDALFARGILYAPDYVVNAGGLLSVLFERGLTDAAGVLRRVREIGQTLETVLRRAEACGLAPHRMADRMAEERLEQARATRLEPREEA